MNLITYYCIRITKANSQKVKKDRYNAYKNIYDYMGKSVDTIPDRVGGMAYYKDKDLTQFSSIDPYHYIRKSQAQNFAGCRVWCEVVK